MKNGYTWLTLIVSKANPNIPSILPAMNDNPLREVASPKVIFLAVSPASVTTSLLNFPDTPPDPYWILKVVLLDWKVDD